jgi:hypothetical protein
MKQPLPPPKKENGVTVYEVEIDEEELEETILVPLEDKNTRLVVKLRPVPNLFSV